MQIEDFRAFSYGEMYFLINFFFCELSFKNDLSATKIRISRSETAKKYEKK